MLPDGQLGELVFTSLSKEALPMVRYRTRDLTRLLPGTARPMRRIGKITGRSDDMLIIRGVNVFPTQIEEQVLKIKQLSEMYEIHLYRNGNLDSVEVHVELRAECQHLDEGQRKLLTAELTRQIKTYIGISTRAPAALRHAQAFRGQGLPRVRQTVGQLIHSAAFSAPASSGAFLRFFGWPLRR